MPYNAHKYRVTRQCSPPPGGKGPMWLDERHAALLYEVAKVHRWAKVLEIGAFEGAGTSAFIQCLDEGAAFSLHVVDIQITPELKRLVGQRKVHLHECRSVQVIDGSHDLVMVDGDHSLLPVAEEWERLQRSGWHTIAMHDTMLQDNGDGSRWLARQLRPYPHLEDARPRPGEWTERGFLVASKDASLIERLRFKWESVCQ